jgi:hypothetical protein
LTDRDELRYIFQLLNVPIRETALILEAAGRKFYFTHACDEIIKIEDQNGTIYTANTSESPE